MARAGTHKGLFPRNGQLYAPSPDHRTKVGIQRFVQDILLVTEAAADIRLDNPYLSPVDTERLSAYAAANMKPTAAEATVKPKNKNRPVFKQTKPTNIEAV